MNKSDTLHYIGNLSQLGGCRHYTLTEGWARGMRATDISTSAGLQYTILPDRGMDISLASYKGINLVYLTCNVLCKSRKVLREENSLPVLQPGESAVNHLEVVVKDMQ
jgi:hypothetical protein